MATASGAAPPTPGPASSGTTRCSTPWWRSPRSAISRPSRSPCGAA